MKEAMKIIKSLVRLYIIHITAILAVASSMYFPGLDLLLAVLYLVILRREANYNQSWLGRTLIGIGWQLPGLLFSFLAALSFKFSESITYYSIFMLELWHTPVLPVISLFPAYRIFARPLYYYLLFASAPILAVLYSNTFNKHWLWASEKSNPLA